MVGKRVLCYVGGNVGRGLIVGIHWTSVRNKSQRQSSVGRHSSPGKRELLHAHGGRRFENGHGSREGTRNSRKDTEIEKGQGSRGGTRKFEKRYGSSSGLMAGFGIMMVSGVGCVPKGREQAEEVEEE